MRLRGLFLLATGCLCLAICNPCGLFNIDLVNVDLKPQAYGALTGGRDVVGVAGDCTHSDDQWDDCEALTGYSCSMRFPTWDCVAGQIMDHKLEDRNWCMGSGCKNVSGKKGVSCSNPDNDKCAAKDDSPFQF